MRRRRRDCARRRSDAQRSVAGATATAQGLRLAPTRSRHGRAAPRGARGSARPWAPDTQGPPSLTRVRSAARLRCGVSSTHGPQVGPPAISWRGRMPIRRPSRDFRRCADHRPTRKGQRPAHHKPAAPERVQAGMKASSITAARGRAPMRVRASARDAQRAAAAQVRRSKPCAARPASRAQRLPRGALMRHASPIRAGASGRRRQPGAGPARARGACLVPGSGRGGAGRARAAQRRRLLRPEAGGEGWQPFREGAGRAAAPAAAKGKGAAS